MSDRIVICLRGATWRLYPCKLWTGAKTSAGYGHRWFSGKMITVHREALARKLGRPIKPRMQALHHCDTPACYEPEHLFEGTRFENMADMAAKGRHHCCGRYLDQAQRAKVRARFAAGGISRAALGREFGVSISTIIKILAETPVLPPGSD